MRLQLPSLFTAGLSPSTGFDRIQREMDRIFGDFLPTFEDSPLEDSKAGASRTWLAPTVNVRRGDKATTLTFDIPGVSKDDIKVELRSGQLIVRADRNEEKSEDTKEGQSWYRSEGTYYHALALPSEVDANQIEAKYQDGVLSLSIPVSEQQKNVKSIEVKAAPSRMIEGAKKSEAKKEAKVH
jgi:HSP20 family protein